MERWEKVEENPKYSRLSYAMENRKKKKKSAKKYIHRLFAINVKAVLVQLAECRKALGFTARGSSSPNFLAGRMQNLKNPVKL